MLPSLTVVIPVHNEEATVGAVIEAVQRTGCAHEILVVDDGSTDGSWARIQSLVAAPRGSVVAHRHAQRRGKGAAVRTALEHASGDVVVIQDADLEYDPRDLPAILAPFGAKQVNVVYGSRNLRTNPRSSNLFYWGGRGLSAAANLLFGSRLTDEATGYKAVRTGLLRSLALQEEGFGFCAELTSKLLARGENIVEVPVSYRPRSFSAGKKIRWYHGIEAILVMLRNRAGAARRGLPTSSKTRGPGETAKISRPLGWLAGLCLSGAVLAAWHNGFTGPFVFDDQGSILDNPTIHPPLSIAGLLSPPGANGETVGGRPLLNVTFALNVLMSGTSVWGFHLFNIVVHAINACLLFGLIRRTLHRRRVFGDGDGRQVVLFAFVIAAVWAVHPLNTAAVSYIVQRAESLVAMFMLLCLYAFVRSLESGFGARWQIVCVAACVGGVLTKETMVSAPLLVLLYDRVFVGQTLVGSVRKRPWLYAGLAGSWVLLGLLMAASGGRGATAGFGLAVTPLSYLWTQCWALVHYLRLAIWPAPLVFDYGRENVVFAFSQVWPQLAGLALAGLGTALGVWRRSAAAFCAAGFFLILAPTSSIIPVADPIFEHRMYLPLAFVVVLLGVAFLRISGVRGVLVMVGVAVTLGWSTVRRNEDYRAPERLWEGAVAYDPRNARAHTNLAHRLLALGRVRDALPHFREAAELEPRNPRALHNLANALDLAGATDEAIALYGKALAADPGHRETRLNLAAALARNGRPLDALPHLDLLCREHPEWGTARRVRAQTLLRLGRSNDAVDEFARAVTCEPSSAEARFNLGDALAQAGRMSEALAAFQAAVRLDPNHARAHANIGNIHLMGRHLPDAAVAYRKSLQIEPTAVVYTNLALVLAQSGDFAAAFDQLAKARELDPAYEPAEALSHQLRRAVSQPR